MEKIICESTYFYGADDRISNTFFISIKLIDEIDGDILARAAKTAIQRYPYFKVKCIRNSEEYVLVENDGDFNVYNTNQSVTLGSDELNNYLLAVSYWNKSIRVSVFHGLTDGQGLMEFARTLVYYYCKEKYDNNISDVGIKTNENLLNEHLDKEFYNPYVDIMSGEFELPKEDAITNKFKNYNSMRAFNLLEDSRITFDSPNYFAVKIPEKELMEYCRSQDGTPGIVISLLMSRAIETLNPDNNAPIITGMAMSLRNALEAPNYKGSAIAMAYLPYGESLKGKPFDVQATISRGRLLLAADKDRLQVGINNSKQLYSMVDQIPTLEGKKQMIAKVINMYLGASTFQVSYMGPAKLGDCEKYITELNLSADTIDHAMFIEVMAVNGYFFLEIAQEFKEDIYFKAFLEELEKQSISYKIIEDGNQLIPNVVLPK